MFRLHRFGAGDVLGVGFEFEFLEHVGDPHLRRAAFEDGPFLFAEGRDHHVAAVFGVDVVEVLVERPGVQERPFEIDRAQAQRCQRQVAAIVSPVTSTIFDVSLRVLETTTNWFWQARMLTARPAAKAEGKSTISAPASRSRRQPSGHSMSKQTWAPTRPKSVSKRRRIERARASGPCASRRW